MRFAMNQKESRELNKKIWAVEKAAGETADLLAEAREKERKLFSDGAVLQSQLKEIAVIEAEDNKNYSALCRKVPVLFMENVGRTLREKKQQRGANELKYRELTDDQAKQDAEIQNLILAQEENQRHKEHLEAEKAEIKAFPRSICRGEREKGQAYANLPCGGRRGADGVDRQSASEGYSGRRIEAAADRACGEKLENLRQGSRRS